MTMCFVTVVFANEICLPCLVLSVIVVVSVSVRVCFGDSHS